MSQKKNLPRIFYNEVSTTLVYSSVFMQRSYGSRPNGQPSETCGLVSIIYIKVRKEKRKK
jgi:hypothetical protein